MSNYVTNDSIKITCVLLGKTDSCYIKRSMKIYQVIVLSKKVDSCFKF